MLSKKYLLPLIIFLFIIILLPITYYASKKQQQLRGRAVSKKEFEVQQGENHIISFWKYSTDSEIINRLGSPTQILQVDIYYDAKHLPILKIQALKRKNGYAPKPPQEANEYILELVDSDGLIVYSVNFTVPNIMQGIPPLSTEAVSGPDQIVLEKINFAVTVPWFATVKTVRIIDPTKKIVDSATVDILEIIDNRANFYSLRGDEAKPKQKSKWEVFTPTPENYLDITLVGDDYLTPSDLEQFNVDANRFVANLLNYEPFSNRSVQLYFHYLNNTQDLGCQYSQSIGRLLYCDDILITEILNNSGVPYDKILVIYNNSRYGGSGGIDVAVAYNGQWGDQVIVHEFGHTLSRLADEYLAYYAGARRDKNCYDGIPPNPAWSGIVADNDYYLECNFPGWYRSSLESIMRMIESHSFNAISRKYLDESIDYYAGPIITTPFLFPGWNVVKLPVDLINGLTAKTLLNDLNTHCGSLGTKIRAIGLTDNNSWQDYVSDFGGNDFQLEINRDYWLKSDGYCLYQPAGID